MSHHPTNSSKPTVPSNATPHKRYNTNWHEAVACAVQIELHEYEHLLQFQSEYILGKNNYRIDLLIIRKLCEEAIPKNIAYIFKTYNLFEIKGIGSSLSTDSYYKTIGYAGLFINQTGNRNQYTALDISLSFLSFHYPKSLISHLQKDRNLVVEKFSNGVYHIVKEIFCVQIIVTKGLLPEENLYLHCLTVHLNDTKLIKHLVDNYQSHKEQDIYTRYMNQLTNANLNEKGKSPMFEEMMERARMEAENYYANLFDTLNNTVAQLSSTNEQLSSKVNYLEELLRQNNIQFD